MNIAQFGNDLYTGRRSIDFVGRQKTWYAISAVLLALAILGISWHGLRFGIEFRGGSEYRISNAVTADYEAKAKSAVTGAGVGGLVESSVVGDSVRVQTEAAGEKNEAVKTALAKSFGVDATKVSASLIGPSWGASVSAKALQGLIAFLVLVGLFMAVYFRTWKMAVSGLLALAHDLLITVGVYALAGFEITPASMIGFLTILGYSLYDTVVVFDKVRENTADAFGSRRMSYAAAANLAVNQTLVRSINTTVVALLPIFAILVVGVTKIGPGTLVDLSLALFVGIAVGAYSSIFVATPLLVWLRRKEPAVLDLGKHARRVQASAPTTAAGASADGPVDGPLKAVAGIGPVGRPLHKYASTGPRNQPKRPPRSRR